MGLGLGCPHPGLWPRGSDGPWLNAAQYLVQYLVQYLIQSVQHMAPSGPQALTNLILQMAAAAKDGAALKDILVMPALSVQRRKVQRRLQALVKEGRLRQEGATRATRYWLVASPPEPI
jgi:hypothetical protein